MSMDTVDGLRSRLWDFAEARDWQRFHTPRNLALALGGEVGELLAELQWASDEDLAEQLRDAGLFERLSDEAADVLIYLIRFADVCGIDLLAAAEKKITRNEYRYPVGLSRGSSAKYTELGTDDNC